MPDEQPSKAKTCFRGEGYDQEKKPCDHSFNISSFLKDKIRHETLFFSGENRFLVSLIMQGH